jgi:hypothetical protein
MKKQWGPPSKNEKRGENIPKPAGHFEIKKISFKY